MPLVSRRKNNHGQNHFEIIFQGKNVSMPIDSSTGFGKALLSFVMEKP